MDGFIIDDTFTAGVVNAEQWTPEAIEAAMEKMLAVVQESQETRILTADDFSLYRCHRRYAEMKLQAFKESTPTDTGMLLRSRFDIMPIIEPRTLILVDHDELMHDIDELLAKFGWQPEVEPDTSDDTRLECIADSDTALEG